MCRPSGDLQRSLSKAGKILLVAILAGLLAGCQLGSTAVPTQTLTNTLTSSPSFTPPTLPEPSRLPTPTPTVPLPTATPFPPLAELPTSEISYLIPLTLQLVGERSAQLLFELDHAATGDILLGMVDQGKNYVQSIPISPNLTYQQINLGPLEPGTAYEVVLGLRTPDGSYAQPAFLGEAWGSLRFHTQPTAEPLRVGVIGDSGFGEPVTAQLAGLMAGHPLDFVIHTGDLVYKAGENASPAEAFSLKYFQPFAPLLHQLPIYPVPGNHDYASDARVNGTPYYFHAFPPLSDAILAAQTSSAKRQYYALVYQNIQFIFLDSQVFFGEEGRLEQDTWLAQRLQDDQFAYSVVISHVPPFTSSAINTADSLAVRQAWQPLFASAHVPLVLSGHSHDYERLIVDGVTYLVSGGGSDALYPLGVRDPHSQAFVISSHFVFLEFYEDQIKIVAIDKNRKILDQAQVPLQ